MARVSITGIQDLTKKLDSMRSLKTLELAMNKAAGIVLAEAVNRVPVDIGELRSSLTIVPASLKLNGELASGVATSKEYAPYVEFGTGRKGQGTYPYEVEGLSLGYRQTPWVFRNKDGEKIWTAGQVAQPFLYPALQVNKDKIRKVLATAI